MTPSFSLTRSHSQFFFSVSSSNQPTFNSTGMLVHIGSGQTSLGIKAANGVVISTEKKLSSVLVEDLLFEAQISGENIETGKSGGDRQFSAGLHPCIPLSKKTLFTYLLACRMFTDTQLETPLLCFHNQESGVVISDAEKRIPVGEMLKGGKVTGSISTNTANGEYLTTKRCGALRGQGWKYGSGFVDGIFPVLSPVAHQILNFVRKECSRATLFE